MTKVQEARAGAPKAVHTSGRHNEMTCAEFQRELPLIIDAGGTEEQEEHLKSCKVCCGLVNDLRYIADQAKLLIPLYDPSPKVWDGIEQKLKVEGLGKPAQARRSI
ncbi:MAG TPA: hypothetical protein VM578_07800 [Candidatus Saccharimonadales bacterium]|nr:hypothetical protein [Candidatus Saccharimonadales bacterium]